MYVISATTCGLRSTMKPLVLLPHMTQFSFFCRLLCFTNSGNLYSISRFKGRISMPTGYINKLKFSIDARQTLF